MGRLPGSSYAYTVDAVGSRRAVSYARATVRWARRCLAVVVPLTVFVAGGGPADVRFTFDNRTDAVLCEYPSTEEAAGARCLVVLEPRAKTGGGRDCANDESRPIPVIITVKQGGRQIYNRTASCGEWYDSERRFIIEQQGDEFIVTDSLSDSTPGP